MRARLRPLGLIGLLVGVLFTLLVTPGGRAVAQESTLVTIELTAVSPMVLTDHGELVISGRVTNNSDDELHQAEVRLWRDATPLTTIAALSQDTSAARRGALLESASARQLLNDGSALAPGDTAEFTVRAALGPNAPEQTWLSEPDAAYLVGVAVFVGYDELGRASTLLGYPGAEPVPFGTIVVLNARPSLLPLDATGEAPPVFANTTLVAELSGRLAKLLELSERPGVLTVLDPALYSEVQALAQPHRIAAADGSWIAGSQANQDLAAAWLTRVDQLAANESLARGLYGSPDVTSAVASGHAEVLTQASTALPTDHPLAKLPLVVVPAGGQLDQPTAAELAAAEPWLVLGSGLPGERSLQIDQQLTMLAVLSPPDATTETDQLADRGRQLAYQLVGARAGSPQVQVVSTSAQVDVELDELAWRVRRPLAELLAEQQPEHVVLPPGQTEAAGEPLLAATDRATAVLGTWGDLVADPDLGANDLAGIIATGWSTSFGRNAGDQARWITRASQPATQMITPQAVQLRISDWVTTSADANLLPVTVINTTDHAVQVRVHFESANPLRISVDDSELLSVQPGESTTVRVRPRTHGNGKVAISAQLSTAGGHPIGEPTSFIITGTEAGRVAWLIIVASGAVLLVATALRVRQVRLERREA